jgi:copper(I)-binding protein
MKISLLVTLLCLALPAVAQVTVGDPWVRATVPAQKATGAFMQITAATDARLVEAKSPVAGMVQVHEMSMDGGVMKMRELDKGLALPAGKTVDLKPGGYHVMLMELKQQMKEGDSMPLTLVFESADKKRTSIEVKAAIRALNAQGAAHRP